MYLCHLLNDQHQSKLQLAQYPTSTRGGCHQLRLAWFVLLRPTSSTATSSSCTLFFITLIYRSEISLLQENGSKRDYFLNVDEYLLNMNITVWCTCMLLWNVHCSIHICIVVNVYDVTKDTYLCLNSSFPFREVGSSAEVYTLLWSEGVARINCTFVDGWASLILCLYIVITDEHEILSQFHPMVHLYIHDRTLHNILKNLLK